MGLELDITAVMRPWTEQMGLPVLKLTEDAGQITATPKRFLQNPDADPSQPESQFGSVMSFRLRHSVSCLITGLILGLRPANERLRYKVTPSLIGWAQT